MWQYGKHSIVPCLFETISSGSLLLNDIIGHLDAILGLYRPQEAIRVQRLSSKLFVQARFTLKSGTTERAVDCVGKDTSSSAQLTYCLEREMEGESNRKRENGEERERKGEGKRETLREFLLVHPES